MNTSKIKTSFKRILTCAVIKFSNIFRLRIYELSLKEKEILDVLNNDFSHAQSVKTFIPSISNNKPVPWFTYPAINYLDQFDLTGSEVLEFGSGASTLYWIDKKCQVISVEHNPEWFYNFKPKVENLSIIDYRLYTDKNYFQFDLEGRKFDLIIIDGIHREECSLIAVKHLKDEGIIILDNSERYPDICQHLRNTGLIEIDFHGFGPINSYTWTTSIFFRKHSLLPSGIQPQIPPGGVA